jgi:hypothetical protein
MKKRSSCYHRRVCRSGTNCRQKFGFAELRSVCWPAGVQVWKVREVHVERLGGKAPAAGSYAATFALAIAVEPAARVKVAAGQHQWLRDHGIRVVRNCQFFVAGATIEGNIVRAVAHSDKILAIPSRTSRDRDWPRFERQLAEQVEALGSAHLCCFIFSLDASGSQKILLPE